ncbi:MAG: NADH:flavin oxidoreductase [Gorillibacterium sp.]|nr:NADH:flavin oxidoreductase [Gorillibacterium sp.]
MEKLFNSFMVKGHEIRNRVVMPPMEFLVRETRNGRVNDGHLKHYGMRAKGGVGLIIVEATSIHPNSLSVESQLGAWSDDHIPGLKSLASECHTYGAKIFLQLQHLGVKMHASSEQDVYGPSEYHQQGLHARAMTLDELHELQDSYVQAALRANQAGFDGIEFHGAHGYLLNQFSSPELNKREDIYGGSLENRLRFVREIIQRVKLEVDDNFILSYRMGCNQPTLEEGIDIAKKLEEMGIDILHVSSCGFSSQRPELPETFIYNWVVYGGSQIKQQVNIPVIVVYDIRTPERADDILNQGLADFTAIGRELIVDPDWVNKAMNHDPIYYCKRCQPCVVFVREKCVML